jgi:acyl-CoA synthetase (AMP-forming)/AMP-acid ligase II
MRPQTDGLALSPETPLHEVTSVRPDHIALALTTSGTTSRPKVVTLTHADIYLAALDTAASVALSDSDRLLNIMPLYHSHGLVGGMVTSLSAGASVICSPGFDAVRFFRWMEELEPTWYTAAPTLHQAILARAKSARAPIAHRKLRLIRSTSAALPDAVYRGLEEQFGVPVIQAYALTESAGVVTSNPLPPEVRKVGSVGVPCGIDIGIRDAAGRQLAAGETGEITIRGERVIRAYEKSDDATRASSFVDGWLRTGDSGYIDADGYLYVTGRLKEVINRGGEKINPNEIDAVLIEHPAVEQVCTFGTPHPTLGQDVAAVVVLRTGARAAETELRQFVADRLVYFKVPHRILFVSTLPTGASGKVPRNTLADRFKADLAEDATKRAPSLNTRSALEATVGKLYEDVLQVASVSPDDSFFDLGGDSMLGAQVIARLNAIVGYRVPLLVLFDNPTVSQFSHAIEGFHAEPEGSLRPMSQRARSADAERSR